MRNWLLQRPLLALAVTFFTPMIGAGILYLVYVSIAIRFWPEVFSPSGIRGIALASIAVGGGFLLFFLLPFTWMLDKLDRFIFGFGEEEEEGGGNQTVV